MKSNQVVLFAFVALASTVPAYSSKRSFLHGGGGGYNDFNCKPSAEHPNPVIMLHGLGANANVWSFMGPYFALKGYCAFSMTYGRLPNIPLLGGLNDLISSAQEVSNFVDKVLASTGASKVDLLGHSEGSTLTRVYLKYNNGVAKTGSLAAIGSNQYGSSFVGLTKLLETSNLKELVKDILDPVCKSCPQLATDSQLFQDLNRGQDAYPTIKYLMLVSKYDQVMTPYKNGFLKTKGPNVHNVVLQDLCPLDLSEHFLQLVDPIAFHAIDSFFSTGLAPTPGCLSLL
ncbi:MAG: secreted lipase [Benniella sp.]|nr:MAG: secreted lipase [Benniella sp.]